MEQKAPIMMTKGYWINSQLSLARFSGGCRINGNEYLIVPPAFDLVRLDFIPLYKKVGRDKFMEVLKENIHTSDKELKDIYKALCKEKKGKENELNLFENEQDNNQSD